VKRNALLLATALLCSCGSCGAPGTPSDEGGPGAECTANADCLSGICIGSNDVSALGFCSATCQHPTECLDDFPGGCCIPTTDGQTVCAIASLCNDLGDAGLGDPCPNHTECAPGGICIFSSDNAISECSQVCRTTADCGGLPEECCEDLGTTSPQLLCVLDAQCAEPADAGPSGFDGGPIGPGGDDGGPFYAALLVNGTLVADTTSFQGTVGPSRDTLFAPALDQNLELDVPAQLAVGTYACDGGGELGDGGSGISGVALTRPGRVLGFADLLPPEWQSLVIPLRCGVGVVTGSPGLSVDAATLEVSAFTPGRVRGPDAGPSPGHLTGTASWRVSDPSGLAGTLEVNERFDVSLAAP